MTSEKNEPSDPKAKGEASAPELPAIDFAEEDGGRADLASTGDAPGVDG